MSGQQSFLFFTPPLPHTLLLISQQLAGAEKTFIVFLNKKNFFQTFGHSVSGVKKKFQGFICC